MTHVHHYDPDGIERVASEDATIVAYEGIDDASATGTFHRSLAALDVVGSGRTHDHGRGRADQVDTGDNEPAGRRSTGKHNPQYRICDVLCERSIPATQSFRAICS